MFTEEGTTLEVKHALLYFIDEVFINASQLVPAVNFSDAMLALLEAVAVDMQLFTTNTPPSASFIAPPKSTAIFPKMPFDFRVVSPTSKPLLSSESKTTVLLEEEEELEEELIPDESGPSSSSHSGATDVGSSATLTSGSPTFRPFIFKTLVPFLENFFNVPQSAARLSKFRCFAFFFS